ncbi:MAG: double-strand break repair protein AddB, partial [Rhizobiaceae bacterium]
MSDRPNIWTIPPGVPFLPTLADAVASGRLTGGRGSAGLEIADTTIYVPTRRAARTLRSCFVERMDNRATILPTIRPLGEFDDDGAEFLDLPGTLLDAFPPVSQHERLFSLAPLVRSWKSRLPAHIASLFDEELIVPASTADAIWLARDLATLLDQVETEEVSWAELGSLVPDELAGWWQITLEFLQIVTEYWPNILNEKQRSDPAAWRSSQINAETERLLAGANRGPVIAAGSTGSIPATARLLAAIASNSSGAVVLPGLDKELDDDSWALIDKTDAAPSVFGHPQYGLKKLLARLGAGRDDVEVLAGPTEQLAARERLVNEALRPAESTDKWLVNKAEVERAIASGALVRLALIEAPDERHEAFAIAVALRLAVAEPGHRAALVTGDRTLARRVSAELSRFDIEADDSGGRILASPPPAALFLLLAETAFRPGDASALLDLLTHPLLLCGEPRAEARRLAAFAELVLLRGG